MNFVKKIFCNIVDESVHLQFQKFSRGKFQNRAIFKVKNSSGKYTISTGPEFGNELVRMLAEKLGERKTRVEGIVISAVDLNGIDCDRKKMAMGIRKYLFDREMSGWEILDLLKKFPKNFFGLSFSADGDILKIKPKAPKSGKPSSKKNEERPKADFCKLVTTDKKITESFVFEKQDFKNAEIYHDFIIESIVIPESLKNEKNFAAVRENSLRKGKIIRRGEIDGGKIREEKEFEA